ncbi:MAG TPA: circadian clock KaiB family protein [Longimicrobiaceae bacterium]|nr:circadian clock KaiB family protein [Longimicrobiaceae bacterium]
MGPVRFTLYVAGDSPRSRQAVANLRHICESELEPDCEFTVVDVTETPERAEAARILTTPTLVREAPVPARRVTGDLSDLQRVATALGLQPRSRFPEVG